MDFKKVLPAVIIGLILGLMLFFLTPELSRIGAIFFFELFCLLILWIVDRLLLPSVDIIKEIVEKQNVAIVLFILGLIAIPLLAS